MEAILFSWKGKAKQDSEMLDLQGSYMVWASPEIFFCAYVNDLVVSLGCQLFAG